MRIACVASVSVWFWSKRDRGRGFSVLIAREMKQEPKNERGGRGREGRIRCEKTGNKRVICPATLLQNKLNSDVARFTTHGQTC